MKHHRMMLATLAISILTGGQALAIQDVPTESAAEGSMGLAWAGSKP